MAAARMSALVLVILALPAAAQPASEAKARTHYAAGLQLFKEGRYEAAREEFRTAHDLAPYPGLLFNLAECVDRLGRTTEALAAYRRYLDAAPSSPRRAQVQARMAALEATLPPAPSPAPVEKPPHAVATPPAAVAGPPPAVEKPPPAVATPDPAVAAPAPVAAPPRARPLYRRWWLWTVVGVVTAGIVVGAVVGATVHPTATPDGFMPNLPTAGRGALRTQ